METINAKIKELLKVSAVNLIGEKDFCKKFDAKMENQERLMDELKTLAKAKGTLVGRVIQIPHADSYALYLVTKVSKTTATVVWLDWCDGWQDDILDAGCDIPIAKASALIGRRDALDAMFSKTKF